MIMRVAAADRVGEVVNRVLEVVANPLNIHGYIEYPWKWYMRLVDFAHEMGGIRP